MRLNEVGNCKDSIPAPQEPQDCFTKIEMLNKGLQSVRCALYELKEAMVPKEDCVAEEAPEPLINTIINTRRIGEQLRMAERTLKEIHHLTETLLRWQ
jgi:hypothetical protein